MKRLFLFLTVAAAVCCAACSDDPEVAESNLSLLEDNVTFDMFGGRSVLEITADSPWTVSCDDDWCRTNVAEGSHTKKIVLTVDQSFLPEERTTAVRFYAAGEEKHTVTVTQEKFEPILVLAENGADITVYGAGSEPALNLRASVAWKIEGATDWCAVSQSEGTKSSVVKLLLTDDGEGVRPRSATLTVSSEMEGVEPQQVTVVQRSTGANTVVVRAGSGPPTQSCFRGLTTTLPGMKSPALRPSRSRAAGWSRCSTPEARLSGRGWSGSWTRCLRT